MNIARTYEATMAQYITDKFRDEPHTMGTIIIMIVGTEYQRAYLREYRLYLAFAQDDWRKELLGQMIAALEIGL